MSVTLKRILSIIVIIAILFGWFVTLFGIGDLNSAKEAIKYGLDINGGVYVVLEAQTENMGLTADEEAKLMEQTREVINNRVNQLGVSESTVTIEGTNRIRVEMPGVQDANEAIDVIGTTAKLMFMTADGKVVLDGSYVKDAQVATDGAHYKILLEFDSEGAKAFEQATYDAYHGNITVSDNLSWMNADQIAIVLDDTPICVPAVNQVISGGSCEITGNFSLEEADTTAALIRGGALPVELKEIQSSVQSATIGADALDKSIIAGAIGLAVVFIIMLIFYGLLGLVADLALLLYVVMFIWANAALNVVLTLPGIAALILSIGMAVDANVIIFARIREEIAAGKSIRVSVESGFKNALATVLDAQITTLIAAVVLYEVGTTTVKGFALTLIIGIVLSIFTAVLITQLFMSLLASNPKFAKNKYFGMNEDGTPKQIVKKAFNFMKHRKIYYIASAAVIVIGIVFALAGGMNYGIDFTGGTKIQIEMGQKVDIAEVENELSEYDLDPQIIYAGEGNTQIIINTSKYMENEERAEIVNTLGEKYGVTTDDVLASENFGPSVGDELKSNALLAVAIAAVGMLIYIIIRFRSWKYGITAIIGLVHDVLVVLAFYAIFGFSINNPFIAAILTLVGYSINDTIVIFDRIRENRKLTPRDGVEANIDKSLNQTLNRTILTSLTTLVVMIPMLIMVSVSISEFIIPLMVGVIVGCYSSIFICSPLYYEMTKHENESAYTKKIRAKAQSK